jgi:glutaminyl-peptide cyclotransferase
MKYNYCLFIVIFITLISACTSKVQVNGPTVTDQPPGQILTILGEKIQQLPANKARVTATPLKTDAASAATEGSPPFSEGQQETFQGERAYKDVKEQVAFGPRIPGSAAHDQTVKYIQNELNKAGWDSQIQETQFAGQEIRNIIATRGGVEQVEAPWIILGAHYDTRLVADRDLDPAKQSQPVPGANDGASGVAVLLELARALPQDMDKRVWLVFFDAEDNGRIPGWDWILGSRVFVETLEDRPEAAVIIDMVGDADLNIPLEQNSDPLLAGKIWQVADELGYGGWFINSPGVRILDDHIPFLEVGIPAVDIIDIDYPYWHTSEDTPDKVSPKSLQVVGDTLLAWLNQTWSP